jgi:hypothetical protein
MQYATLFLTTQGRAGKPVADRRRLILAVSPARKAGRRRGARELTSCEALLTASEVGCC